MGGEIRGEKSEVALWVAYDQVSKAFCYQEIPFFIITILSYAQKLSDNYLPKLPTTAISKRTESLLSGIEHYGYVADASLH